MTQKKEDWENFFSAWGDRDRRRSKGQVWRGEQKAEEEKKQQLKCSVLLVQQKQAWWHHFHKDILTIDTGRRVRREDCGPLGLVSQTPPFKETTKQITTPPLSFLKWAETLFSLRGKFIIILHTKKAQLRAAALVGNVLPFAKANTRELWEIDPAQQATIIRPHPIENCTWLNTEIYGVNSPGFTSAQLHISP